MQNHSFEVLELFGDVVGLSYLLSLCLDGFSNSEHFFWCAVCKTYPALMWVATSSIGFGEMDSSGFAVVLRSRLSSACSVIVFIEVLFGGFLVVLVWVPHPYSKDLSSVLGGVKFPSELVSVVRLSTGFFFVVCSGGDSSSRGFLDGLDIEEKGVATG
ncbi:hypothetical protein Bca52824_032779 [Brassica carinata]|uniref:Transmembrane protein n=1 Tax=Brassica carinata TaxID=52824 RepID=A0A8X7SDD4_BRACI|nr:hypothetical protein Bca52824_032779 [Brassica carinata]